MVKIWPATAVHARSKIDGETLVLVFARSGLMAIDPEQGQVRWQFEHRAAILESVNAMMPVVDGDHVFISECYEVGSALLRSTRSRRKSFGKIRRETDAVNRCGVTGRRRSWSMVTCMDAAVAMRPTATFAASIFKPARCNGAIRDEFAPRVTRVGDHLIVLEERGLLQ